MRPSATSMWAKTSVVGNLSCRLCEVSVLVRSECGDVDEAGNALVGSGGCDDGPAVGVADEDGRAGDPPQRAFHGRNVALEHESRLFWVDTTSCPSACSVGITLL